MDNITYCFQDSSPPCPRQTASRSHDQPILFVSEAAAAGPPCLDLPLVSLLYLLTLNILCS